MMFFHNDEDYNNYEEEQDLAKKTEEMAYQISRAYSLLLELLKYEKKKIERYEKKEEVKNDEKNEKN